MKSESDLATVASLIGESTRATILLALLGGKSIPASELAKLANVSPQTASSHLLKLKNGGLIDVHSSGRHRYYRLKSKDIANVIETLITISPPIDNFDTSTPMKPIHFARSCYDHLAGKLGVMITDALITKNVIVENNYNYNLTKRGSIWLHKWEIDEKSLHHTRRKFAFPCLDWSERRYHLAGALGASFLQKLFEKDLLRRADERRVLKITVFGKAKLEKEFDLDLGPFLDFKI